MNSFINSVDQKEIRLAVHNEHQVDRGNLLTVDLFFSCFLLKE